MVSAQNMGHVSNQKIEELATLIIKNAGVDISVLVNQLDADSLKRYAPSTKTDILLHLKECCVCWSLLGKALSSFFTYCKDLGDERIELESKLFIDLALRRGNGARIIVLRRSRSMPQGETYAALAAYTGAETSDDLIVYTHDEGSKKYVLVFVVRPGEAEVMAWLACRQDNEDRAIIDTQVNVCGNRYTTDSNGIIRLRGDILCFIDDTEIEIELRNNMR